MPVPTKSAANTRGQQYSAVWKTETLGYTQDVDPSGLNIQWVEHRIGELNDVLVDKLARGGVEGRIRMTLHDVITERIRQLMPWAAATGSFSLSPTAIDFSAYANAGPLVLHPVGSSGTTDDFTFLKAFPASIALPKSAGKQQQVMVIEWEVYPDRAALEHATTPTVVYGYRGAAPA